jgi:hypothetical protein
MPLFQSRVILENALLRTSASEVLGPTIEAAGSVCCWWNLKTWIVSRARGHSSGTSNSRRMSSAPGPDVNQMRSVKAGRSIAPRDVVGERSEATGQRELPARAFCIAAHVAATSVISNRALPESRNLLLDPDRVHGPRTHGPKDPRTHFGVLPPMTILALAMTWVLANAQQPTDLSGTWKFDQAKTMRPGPDGRVVLAAMLGDQFVALQTQKSLTLRITFKGELVVAVYDLTGAESANMSPGDIPVKSRASWEGKKLLIDSFSESMNEGKLTRVTTRRVIWIDDDGDLIVERSGTPATVVTSSKSVYRRVQAAR